MRREAPAQRHFSSNSKEFDLERMVEQEPYRFRPNSTDCERLSSNHVTNTFRRYRKFLGISATAPQDLRQSKFGGSEVHVANQPDLTSVFYQFHLSEPIAWLAKKPGKFPFVRSQSPPRQCGVPESALESAFLDRPFSTLNSVENDIGSSDAVYFFHRIFLNVFDPTVSS